MICERKTFLSLDAFSRFTNSSSDTKTIDHESRVAGDCGRTGEPDDRSHQPYDSFPMLWCNDGIGCPDFAPYNSLALYTKSQSPKSSKSRIPSMNDLRTNRAHRVAKCRSVVPEEPFSDDAQTEHSSFIQPLQPQKETFARAAMNINLRNCSR